MPLAAKVRRSTATLWPVRLSLRRRPLTSSRRGPLQAILRPSHNIFLNTSDPLSQSSAHLGCLPPHSSSYSPLPFSPLIVTLLVTRIVLRHQQAILHSMFTPLVVLLVLAVLLEPVAASSPVVEQTLIAAPMEQIYSYPDPDGMLDAICDVCRISVYLCDHAFPPDQTFTPALFLEHPEWPQDPLPPLAEPAPSLPYLTNSDTQPLRGDIVRSLEDNATTIQPSTIHAHLDDIYNPGDRYPGARPVGSRRPPGRRQAPKARGFPCPAEGCEKTFDRSCDLKRHQKTHLGPSERPHKCSSCNAAFLYPKDRNRHQRTHEQESSSQNPLYCCVPGCNNVDGFSRRDNLLRHQRKQHPHLIAV